MFVKMRREDRTEQTSVVSFEELLNETSHHRSGILFPGVMSCVKQSP